MKEIQELEAMVSLLKDEVQEQRDINKQLLSEQGSEENSRRLDGDTATVHTFYQKVFLTDLKR